MLALIAAVPVLCALAAQPSPPSAPVPEDALPPPSAAPAPTPALPSVAVLPFRAGRGVEPALASQLTHALVTELRAAAVFSRVLPDDGAAPDTPPSACTDDACHAREAGALGVDLMVVGSVERTGAALELQARLVELPRARTLSTFARQVCGTRDEALVRVARPAARRLLVDAQYLEPHRAGALLPAADTCDERVLPSAGPDPTEEAPEPAGGPSPLRPALWLGAGVAGSVAALAALGALVAAGTAVTAAVLPRVAAVPVDVVFTRQDQRDTFWLAMVAIPAVVAGLAVLVALGLAAGAGALGLTGLALPG